MGLPRPATGVELYLAAIHDRLGEILGRLDGGQASDPWNAPERFTSSIPAAEQAAVAPAEQQPAGSPTRRTRTRTRTGGEQR